MRAGQLRHLVTLQKPGVRVDDSMGGGSLPYDDVVTLRASIEPLQGEERLIAGQQEAAVTHRIKHRFYPGIKPSWRVKYIDAEMAKIAESDDPTPGLRLFDIDEIIDPEERHREIHLMSTELVDW